MPTRGGGSCWEGEGCIQNFIPNKRKFCLCLFTSKNLSYSKFFFSDLGCGRKLTGLEKDSIFLDWKKLTLLPEWFVPLDIVGPNWGSRCTPQYDSGRFLNWATIGPRANLSNSCSTPDLAVVPVWHERLLHIF